MSTTYPNGTLGDIGLEYPLEWLDRFVTVSLNPEYLDHELVEPAKMISILDHLKDQEINLQLLIRSQSFSLNESDAGALIKRYHNLLLGLLDQTLEYRQLRNEKIKNEVSKIFDATINCIEVLLSFIEKWFTNYLSLEERVTPNYLSVTKEELKKRLKVLKERIELYQGQQAVIKLILRRLNHFIKMEKYPFEVTFRAILYVKELFNKLEEVNWELPAEEVTTALHELLIYLNFNSKTYIKQLTADVLRRVSQEATDAEQMEKLLYYYKALNQIHSKPGAVLNPGFHDLEIVLKNWFEEEIAFMDKKIQMPVTLPSEAFREKSLSEQTPKNQEKILTALSTDQMGILIRSAVETGLFKEKSLKATFNIIAPGLSSPFKDDLSANGMRSKSYVAEERDKQIAIDWLENLKVHIAGY